MSVTGKTRSTIASALTACRRHFLAASPLHTVLVERAVCSVELAHDEAVVRAAGFDVVELEVRRRGREERFVNLRSVLRQINPERIFRVAMARGKRAVGGHDRNDRRLERDVGLRQVDGHRRRQTLARLTAVGRRR